MCFICDRIKMVNNGTNPYFVKELQTGYVVIGDNQHFKGYTLFLCKNILWIIISIKFTFAKTQQNLSIPFSNRLIHTFVYILH